MVLTFMVSSGLKLSSLTLTRIYDMGPPKRDHDPRVENRCSKPLRQRSVTIYISLMLSLGL